MKKWKTALTLLLVLVLGVSGVMTANAFTIRDDGEYTLCLAVDNDGVSMVGGECFQSIRFRVDEGEQTVCLSDLTAGSVPFNGKTEFSHWEYSNGTEAEENLPISAFRESGMYYTSDGQLHEFRDGLTLYAAFSDKPLDETDLCCIVLDAFAGSINNTGRQLLQTTKDAFQTVNLMPYVPVRNGYTFTGWELNESYHTSKYVVSIDKSYFTHGAVVQLTATYTKNTYEGNDLVLRLDANGGTIDGEETALYDYIYGPTSESFMSLLPYVPERDGYEFTGWNTKKDGSGQKFTHMSRNMWNPNMQTSVEREGSFKNDHGATNYKMATLYATWTRVSKEDPKTKLESTGEIKGTLTGEHEWQKNDRLVITPAEVSRELAEKNVKYAVDIRIMRGEEEVELHGIPIKISFRLPEELKGYDHYEVVYINQRTGTIKETLPATIQNGMISFEATHLSRYGIVATKDENSGGNQTGGTETGSTAGTQPTGAEAKTGDSGCLWLWLALLLLSGAACVGMIAGKIQKHQEA